MKEIVKYTIILSFTVFSYIILPNKKNGVLTFSIKDTTKFLHLSIFTEGQCSFATLEELVQLHGIQCIYLKDKSPITTE